MIYKILLFTSCFHHNEKHKMFATLEMQILNFTETFIFGWQKQSLKPTKVYNSKQVDSIYDIRAV